MSRLAQRWYHRKPALIKGICRKQLNIYQLSGVDDRERGFTRQVEVSGDQNRYQAVLRYEKIKVTADPCNEEAGALQELIRRLHGQGYSQLRTQLIFRGTQYLGTQEIWVEYPEQETPLETSQNLFGWIKRLFRSAFLQ